MNDKLEGLQIGRGLAALAVVIFHAKLILIRFPDDSYFRLPYFYDHGDIGVTFFFVISGFIIAYVISKPSHSTKTFLIKRAFRLWPTYFFCTCLYVAIYLLHRNRAASDIGYSLEYFASSVFFFPMGALPALPPGWSLEHEVIFYLAAAVVGAKYRVKGIFWVLLVSVIIGLFLRVPYTAYASYVIPWDYHLLAPVNLSFLVGVMLYLIWSRKSKFIDWMPTLPVILTGVALIIIAPYVVAEIPTLMESERANRDLTKGYLRFSIESFASFVLLLGLLKYSANGMIAKVFVAIGDRSYSLYLCHFILIPPFQYIHREYISWPQEFAEPLCLLYVLLSVFFSFILYWSIEKPSSVAGAKIASKVR